MILRVIIGHPILLVGVYAAAGISTSSDFGRVETSKLTTAININIIISTPTTENPSINHHHLISAIIITIIVSTHHREPTSTHHHHHLSSFVNIIQQLNHPLLEGYRILLYLLTL
jgi:hypothetical protein